MKAATTMIRLYKLQMDELRKVLREMEEARGDIQHRLTALAIEMAREHEAANEMAQLLAYQNYYAAAIQRREKMNEELSAMDRAIEAQRDQLQAAFTEMKRFEQLDEKARLAARAEAARKDQNFMDEIAANQHSRNNG